PPSDVAGARIAALLREPGPTRDRLTTGIYIPTDDSEPLAMLEKAFRLSSQAVSLTSKVRSAFRKKQIPAATVDAARAAGILTEEEAVLVAEAEAARLQAIQVDSFSLEEYLPTSTQP